ncbi:alginate lyase-domain-containing protein [Xylogone sp. PMI_703]|nr:alginate lyase-domain-containing protein [Xylogone sp. PMI_703]
MHFSLLKYAAFESLVLMTQSTTAVSIAPRNNADINLNLWPNTVVLDGSRLFTTKLLLKLGPLAPSSYRSALSNLLTQADSWLTQGPWTVTSKKILPPGGDIHDYASQAPYWWPNPNTTDGCPYIQKDGVRNPAVDNYTDHGDRGNMFQASYILALAWYYTGEAKYSQHAGDILRTWFLDPATKMNPNLNHAQIIPCQDDGRSIGIIDFSQQYTSTVDAALILSSPSSLLSGIFSKSSAPGWDANDQAGFLSWNKDFLDWLVNSDFGKEEYEADNNHGTFAAMQNAALALYVGNTALASQIARNATSRIDKYVTANGSQPLELVRTRSFHYSTFDLVAYTRLADVAAKLSGRYAVDLWGYKGPQGQSIMKAIEFIIPAAVKGQSAWPYPELEFDAYSASDIVHAGADEGNKLAKQAVGKVPAPPGGDLWLLRPAVEQLDAITS